MRFGLNVKGGEQAVVQIRNLPAKLAQRGIYDGLHNAARVVQKAIVAAAPLGTEPSRKTRSIRTVSVMRGRKRVRLRLAQAQSVSYDYGRLKQNIRRRRASVAATGMFAIQITRGRAFWAFFLEKGTSRMRPQPFWQAAAKSAEAAARKRFEETFAAAVQRSFNKAPVLNRAPVAPRQ
jgi:HK97 gp10 family phage protein